MESLLFAWRFGAAKNPAPCARVAAEELERLERSPSWANIASLGLSCAMLSGDGARTAALEARAREALAIETAADDRSGLYDGLVQARKAAGDEEGMRRTAAAWLTFLEEQAALAPTPAARAVFDSHRMIAAFLLGQPERVAPALEKSERDLPRDYNAPARLAVVYSKMGRLDDALAASDRALRLVYGPRKMRVLNERGDLLLERGDREAARAAFAEVLRIGGALPEPQRFRHEVERAERQLASLAK